MKRVGLKTSIAPHWGGQAVVLNRHAANAMRHLTPMADGMQDQLGPIKSPSPQGTPNCPRVLIAGAGGPFAVAAIKALDCEALDIFSADVDPQAPGLHLVGEDRRLPVSKGRGDSYTELVYELCERHRIDVLIPTVDHELLLLASARTFFAEVGTRIVLPSEKTLRLCLDRWALHRRCDGTVRVPKSTLVSENFDPSHPKLPAVVKSRVTGGSREIQLIERREELERITRDGSLLVQEHLPGAAYSLVALAKSDGRVIAVVPWEQGDSGTAASGCIVRNEKLVKVGRQIAERIGLTSLASIQVKEAPDGEPVLLEVNPYCTGAMPRAAASGVSMLKLCVDGILADD